MDTYADMQAALAAIPDDFDSAPTALLSSSSPTVDEDDDSEVLKHVSQLVDLKSLLKVPTFSGKSPEWRAYRWRMNNLFGIFLLT